MATVPSRPVFLSIRLTTLVVESEMTICDEDTATATGTWLTKAGEPRPGPPATEVSAPNGAGPLLSAAAPVNGANTTATIAAAIRPGRPRPFNRFTGSVP